MFFKNINKQFLKTSKRLAKNQFFPKVYKLSAIVVKNVPHF